MSNLNEISRVVMPTAEFTTYENLFVRRREISCQINGVTRESNVYSFNTWMNMFAAKKHYYYCELGDIFLKLDIEGCYALSVIGSNRNAAFDVIYTNLLQQECDGYCEIRLPSDISEYEGLYFEIVEHKAAPVTFKSAAWCTDVAPQRDNKLAIVTCTFKKEEYIDKNIKKFKKFIASNKDIKELIKLIVVDNGRSLDASTIEDEDVKVIPNINAGGAGGFTRGLIDVVEQDAGFTRVLFMDDDVEIFTESFYRTLVLANYLKEEFKDSFINGAMLDLYKKDLFFENLAIQDGFWVRPFAQNLNLRKYENINIVNNIPADIFNVPQAKVFSAWWYSSFDLSIVAEKGLPLPMFIRSDDVEWGWRSSGKHHISMNGINVWHAPFAWRVSPVIDCYYFPRNQFFLNAVHTDGFKEDFTTYFESFYSTLHKTYDYARMEILMTAMQDILRGSESFRVDPEIQLKSLNELSKRMMQLEKVSDSELYSVKRHVPRVKKWRKTLYRLTKRGAYAPRFLYKKRNISVSEFSSCPTDFIMVKQVRVYNLFTGTCEVRKHDAKKLAAYKKQFHTLLDKIYDNYDQLRDDLLSAHKEFSTLKFWKEYLKID